MKRVALTTLLLALPLGAQTQQVRVEIGCFEAGAARLTFETVNIQGDVSLTLERNGKTLGSATRPAGGEVQIEVPGVGSCLDTPCLAILSFVTDVTGEPAPTSIRGSATRLRSSVPAEWPNPIILGECP